jgi:signal transduction histidine kinase
MSTVQRFLNQAKKVDLKMIILVLLIFLCLLVTYYFHFIVKTQIIFSHIFYIPIVISSIYWKRTGLYIALFLGIYLIISQWFSTLSIVPYDFIRSVMFVVVALIVTIITRKTIDIQNQLKQNRDYIKLIDELKETNEQLQAQKQQLEESERKLKETNTTKDKMFSIISHDLKSPFTSIFGFSDLLIKNFREYDDKQIESFLNNINLTSKHTLILLDNLLDWAGFQSNRITIKKENIDFQLVIDEVIALLSFTAKIKGITLNVHVPNNIVVYTDLNMLQTILRNLISNAIKFTRVGGKIDIVVIQNNNQLEISVIDNGVGISEDVQNKLFQADINYTSSGTLKEKGSGLGLMLCKESVEKLGGKISFMSELGKGSKFKFTIPEKLN